MASKQTKVDFSDLIGKNVVVRYREDCVFKGKLLGIDENFMKVDHKLSREAWIVPISELKLLKSKDPIYKNQQASEMQVKACLQKGKLFRSIR